MSAPEYLRGRGPKTVQDDIEHRRLTDLALTVRCRLCQSRVGAECVDAPGRKMHPAGQFHGGRLQWAVNMGPDR